VQNLLNDLTQLLKQDARLVAEGDILKNKVVELALKPDRDLLRLLLSHKRLKDHFFVDVDGVLVLDKEKFLQFVSNKSFLPDSYTRFKNKIGLSTNDEYLSTKKDVVLVWPYKDCVLEGGQTKEEEKRDEIFWNVILAPDEIDRLFEAKVLTNFKRYDSRGGHAVREIKEAESFVFKGNNLLVLHSLKKRFHEQVKLIYIDPPYNIENDGFNYNDSFNHSTWLTFMKNRLQVAWELLKSDGAIFVQISDVNVSRLRLLLDEIFGEHNFINKITVKTKSPSGFKTVNLGVFEVAEYILIYGKNKKEWKYNPQYVPTEYDTNYSFFVVNKSDGPDRWRFERISETLAKSEGYANAKNYPKQISREVFDLKVADFALKNADRVFRLTEIGNDAGKDTLNTKTESLKKPNQVFVVKREKHSDRYILNGQEMSFYEKKVKKIDGKVTPTTLLTNIWSDIPWEGIAGEGGVKLKRGKKPEKLIRRIIDMGAYNSGDIVLDFFVGSGSTCAVAHKMGKQYIGVEQLDYEENDSDARLQNVIRGDKTGISKVVDWNGGGEFVYCELMTLNERFVQKIKATKTKSELKEIWEKMKGEAFLSYKVDPKEIDANSNDFADLSLEDQKRFLLEVLDKNQLYVNLSEIDDKTYDVSEEDKNLNRQFYGV